MRLSRAVAVGWIAWLLSVVLVWLLYRWRVMHPHFLPLALLLAVQLLAAVMVLTGGLWLVLRGPRRLLAVACMLLGTAPVWLWTAHLTYGMWCVGTRNIPLNLLLKSAAAAAATVMDGEARIRYPQRQHGEHVVMLYNSAADPAADVAAMDRHIRRMHEILGRPPRAKVHWVRGSLTGQGGLYFQGMALGTAPREGPDTDLGLTGLDRHEVAHFAIHHLCGPDCDPPAVLAEGWAESQSFSPPGEVAACAWRQKCQGPVPTVRELTGKEWYHLHYGLVYTLGGALVEYLLQEYGGSRFFELYTTCRPETFAQDCRRILGVTLDELDRKYWEYVEQQAGAQRRLKDVRLHERVDRHAWDSVVTHCSQALETSRQPPNPCRLVWERTVCTRSQENPDGTRTQCRYEFVYDGPRRLLIRTRDTGATAVVATPALSFVLVRGENDPHWKVDRSASRGIAVLDYYDGPGCIVARIASDLPVLPLRALCESVLADDYNNTPVVTGLEKLVRDGKRLVRIEVQRTAQVDRKPVEERRIFELLPDQHWALRSYQSARASGDKSETTFEYDLVPTGVLLPRVIRSKNDLVTRDYFHTSTVRLVECDLAPAAEQSFSPERFGLTVSVVTPRAWPPWYILLTWGGAAVSVLLGSLLTAMPHWKSRCERAGDNQAVP